MTGTPATALLDRLGMAYTLHSYEHDPRGHAFGDEAAQALGVDPEQIFKTLVVTVDGARMACAVVPVAAQLDLKSAAAAVGGKRAELARPEVAERSSGYVVGGISPLAHRTGIPVVIDETAQLWPTVYVSAGRRGLQLRLAPDDLLRATAATYADVTRAS